MNHIVNIFQPRRRDTRSPHIALPSPADSISSSSDGSVPTPEDDPDLSARSSTRLANWLRSSSSSSASKSASSSFSSSSSLKPKSAPIVSANTPLSSLSPLSPPLAPASLSRPSATPPSDSDDDSDDYGEEEEDISTTDSTPLSLPRPPPIPASSSIRAVSRSPGRSGRPLPHPSHQNLRDMTLSVMNQRPPCPPFLHAVSGPIFPRSSNASQLLPVVQTTRIVHFKTTLVRRLEAKLLTPAEHQSIAPFYNRSKHTHNVFSTRRRLDLEDVSDLKDAKRVQDFSFGLQRWINRPCFEERCVAWHWNSDGKEIIRKPIPGSGRAVASLEFSEGLEAMAGFGLRLADGFSNQEPSHRLSVPPVPRLDIQITGSSSPSTGPNTPKNATPSILVRKTMRSTLPFDHSGDDIPLGIRLTMREEQEREERKRKTLAEEVARARLRADAVRTGAADKDNLRDRRQTYSRPVYDKHTSISRSEIAKYDSQLPDNTKPTAARSTTWNGDVPKHRPSPARLSPSSFEGPKTQRRMSMLGSASDLGDGGAASSQSRVSMVTPLPTAPVHSLPMIHTMPMYAIPLQPIIPMFMQPGFIPAPSSPNFDSLPLPLPPPIRPGLFVSRSAERLVPPVPRLTPSAGRRATANPEEMQQIAEQMKRNGLHRETLGRSPLAKTDNTRPSGRLREEQNQTQHKPVSGSRSQSGRTDDMKRFSRASPTFSLPPKRSSSALLVSR